ncbi:VOC family protein [Micromonospora sp. RHAY321]|uniref:VOC family protein n=1 Tax=unclassified Micromonospora TaxID=2617518 RepID=UPI00207C2044|nr:VOC family protein [Micromonospora sp. RHAY321]MCO1593999.1 VOC family protein [Micromonospora sp. RHAY321]
MIATYTGTTLDCADHTALAGFYGQVLGWDIVHSDEGSTYLASSTGARLGFQKVENFVAPVWPDGKVPQQSHLDLEVTDLDEAEKKLVELGATKAEHQPGGDYWRVFLDPAGHPFCIALPMG